jgi:putative FmdB family regulatory protein
MPIYQYQCSECSHSMEALQKMSDEPLKDCPNCNKPGLKKQVTAAAFRLKGGGWYETDFKTGNKKQLADSDSSSKSTPESSAKSSDAKPKAETSTATSSKTKTSTDK